MTEPIIPPEPPDPNPAWLAMSPERRQAILEGAEAMRVHRQGLSRVIAIGRAFHELQLEAMARSHSNRPTGGPYAREYAALEMPVPDLVVNNRTDRSQYIWCYHNRAVLEAWWALSENDGQRERWNHPDAIQRNYRAYAAREKARTTPKPAAGPASAPAARPILRPRAPGAPPRTATASKPEPAPSAPEAEDEVVPQVVVAALTTDDEPLVDQFLAQPADGPINARSVVLILALRMAALRARVTELEDALDRAADAAPIDPAILNASDRQKFDRLKQRLERQFQGRVNDALVQRVDEFLTTYTLPHMRETLDHANRIIEASHGKPFSEAEYDMLRWALHEDQTDEERRRAAFTLVTEKRANLRPGRPEERLSTAIPNTTEEWMAMRRGPRRDPDAP